MATKRRIAAPPIVSRRNKSLVDLQESLQHGFLKHNVENRSGTTLFPVMEDRSLGQSQPAHISPTSSCNDLRQQLRRALVEQSDTATENRLDPPLPENNDDNDPSPRPLKKCKTFETRIDRPATVTATEASGCNGSSPDERVLKRKALAASLRAKGLNFVLRPSEFAPFIYCKNRAEFTPPPAPVSDPGPVEIEIHAKHSNVLYNFVRKGTDLEGFKKCVRKLHEAYNGAAMSVAGRPPPFRCANRFGESLLHLACRRGRTEMVRFLVVEMGSCPREVLSIMDDCHKTPLHDACWTPTPNFELVHLLLEHAPEQVLRKDIRGNTPFDYVRRNDDRLWLRFLWERRHLLEGASTTARALAGALRGKVGAEGVDGASGASSNDQDGIKSERRS